MLARRHLVARLSWWNKDIRCPFPKLSRRNSSQQSHRRNLEQWDMQNTLLRFQGYQCTPTRSMQKRKESLKSWLLVGLLRYQWIRRSRSHRLVHSLLSRCSLGVVWNGEGCSGRSLQIFNSIARKRSLQLLLKSSSLLGILVKILLRTPYFGK